MDSGKLCVWY